MEKRTNVKIPSHTTSRRDKIKMAWRHKSRGEKHLLMVIGFLVFALTCFILAVIGMNFGFKAKIQKLEDEIHDLKSTTPLSTSEDTGETTLSTLPSTTPEVASTTTGPSTTLTTPSTTPTKPITTTTPTSTPTSTSSVDSSIEGEEGAPRAFIFEALRALLFNFSGITSSTKTLEKIVHRGNTISRSHGTFLVMADINHEESESVNTPNPDPHLSADESEGPIFYLDNTNSTASDLNNGTAILGADSRVDDTKVDYEVTTEDLADNLELQEFLEGSGTSAN